MEIVPVSEFARSQTKYLKRVLSGEQMIASAHDVACLELKM